MRFGTNAGPRKVDPVIFPPGCARLATTPSPTGSPIAGAMTGIVTFACFAARARAFPENQDQLDLEARQLGEEVREPLSPALRGSILDDDVLAFHVTEFAQPSPECVG